MYRHVQIGDNSVLERRLRPIYEWLDSGNNKKSMQECDKVLKKTPNLHIAKALKALTLYRMGREREANAILDALTNEKPTDEATLQAMTTCYREMQQMEKVCKLYETAVSLDPTNEELLTHLFMSYVRIGDFSAQQKAAMSLYKQKPKNPYYCWNVMSIVLQATRGEGAKDEKKKALFLSLAEKMMAKLVNDGKIDAEQEVQLYIMILDLLGKYQEIINILEGPLSEKLQCTNVMQLKLQYFKTLKKWNEVNVLSKYLVGEHFERWDYWKEYINSAFELYELQESTGSPKRNHAKEENNVDKNENDMNNSNVSNNTTPDATPETCHEFICDVIENWFDNPYYLRAPYLARFELWKRLSKQKDKNCSELLGDLKNLFLEYFRKFGHKPCCVPDLKIYLHLLNEEERADLAVKLIQDVGISATSVPQSLDQMQKHIGALELSRMCGNHRNLSIDHLKAMVTAFTLHYHHGYQNYGKNLLSTEMGPSDHYALLAAHVLYDLGQLENSSEPLVVATVLLESLLENSPSNFYAKLLLIKYYHMLGDSLDANNIYYSLDIKHLQLDSLGYIHCGRMPTTGLYSISYLHLDTTLKLFSSNYKDVSSTDHLTFSYKFGSFMKLDEFMDFRERLNNSMHYTTCVIDRIINNLIECATVESLCTLDISPQDNNIDWDNLRDNRDLNIYISWEPEFLETSLEQSEVVKQLYIHDLYFLKFRAHIIWSASMALDVLRSFDGTRQKNIEILRTTMKDWEAFENEVASKKFEPTSEKLAVYPTPSRLHWYLKVPWFKVLNSFIEFFISLSNDDVDSAEKNGNLVKDNLGTITENVEKYFKECTGDYRNKRNCLEIAANTVELICVSCIVCMLSNELLKSTPNKKSKRKPTEQKSRDILNVVVNELKSETSKVRELLDDWASKSEVTDITKMLESLNLNSIKLNVYENIESSYAASNKELQTVLKAKIKMLSNFG